MISCVSPPLLLAGRDAECISYNKRITVHNTDTSCEAASAMALLVVSGEIAGSSRASFVRDYAFYE